MPGSVVVYEAYWGWLVFGKASNRRNKRWWPFLCFTVPPHGTNTIIFPFATCKVLHRRAFCAPLDKCLEVVFEGKTFIRSWSYWGIPNLASVVVHYDTLHEVKWSVVVPILVLCTPFSSVWAIIRWKSCSLNLALVSLIDCMIYSGQSHCDVTHWFVDYCFEASSLALHPNKTKFSCIQLSEWGNEL